MQFHTKDPKGTLIIIGGSEHKGVPDDKNDKEKINPDFIEHEILKRLIDECTPENQIIEVIPTASRIPEEIGRDYMMAFDQLGCKSANILDIRTRDDAYEKKFIDRVKLASAVLFSGGDQLRLSTILGGTPVLEIIRKKYRDEKFVIAGTSAGAMVMSNAMIIAGTSEEAFFKGELKISSGLGLMGGVIIDTHFIKRGRFGRLAQGVAINPSYIGIGLEEDTAIVARRNTYLEAIGSGNVILIDGHNIRSTNITEIDEGAPISIEGLTVHVMARGDLYHLGTRKFESSYNDDEK